ncbi:DUF1772-domain-containing protein [Dacryopinax primogenitus]|uniref:DUF1772-domain-containing protein n=1 Tax=Dacryopinax primogenitus (strain DJM 731) TaxID=1858805 RepID=M5FSU2_DACPD|nr:DUF1772-domain-containing protein [Dacryopinax primogenitus]EJT98344.1 DUF1772-domain-containing protein [Dacryopinax primogenitus]
MTDFIPILQVVVFAGAAWLSGYITTFSVAIPHIALAPPLIAAKQWEDFYDRGKLSAPPFGLVLGSLFGYLSYSLGGLSSSQGRVYALAGVVTASTIPYTLIVMLSTNKKLQAYAAKDALSKEEKEAKVATQEVGKLLSAWGAFNAVRAMMPATGALLAGWALMRW